MTASDLLLLITEYEQSGLDAELEADTSLESMVAIYDCLGRAKQALTRTEEHLIEVLHPVVPPGGEHVPGIGRVEAHNVPGSVKWDSEAILNRLVAQALDERKVDEETGAFERSALALHRVLLEATPILTASFGWRRTALKARGFQLDEFSEVGAWKPKVRIIRESEAA